MNANTDNNDINTSLPKIKSVLILIGIIIFFVLISLIANSWFNKQTIRTINIKGNYILTDAEINSIIDDKIMNTEQQGLNLADIKRTLIRNEFIENADVFINSKRILGIKIIERVPFAILINKSGIPYFIDTNKNIFVYKLFNNYTDLPIITNCNSPEQRTNAIKILSELQKKFPFLYAKVCEVSYDKNNYNLILNIADISINIGDITDLDTKLATIESFLNNITKLSNDINKFKKLDARWKNKIVVN